MQVDQQHVGAGQQGARSQKISNVENAAAGAGAVGAGMEADVCFADIKADQKIRQMCRVIPTQSCRPLREVYSGDNTQA